MIKHYLSSVTLPSATAQTTGITVGSVGFMNHDHVIALAGLAVAIASFCAQWYYHRKKDTREKKLVDHQCKEFDALNAAIKETLSHQNERE